MGPASLEWGNGSNDYERNLESLKDLDPIGKVKSAWSPTVLADEVRIKLKAIRQLMLLFQDISWSKMRKMSLS